MVASVSELVESIVPNRTVLLFGAGSSMPSGAPSSEELIKLFASKFHVPSTGFKLSEVASLAERNTSRKAVIESLRDALRNLHPTGGLLNLPLYEWRSIYTTNYDNLIEQCYNRRGLPLNVYSSNFDFTSLDNPMAMKLFKLHGTIEKDVSDGNKSRIILTVADYDQTTNYREQLYDRLKGDLAGAKLIIIGHSLTDDDIRDVVDRAIRINSEAENSGQIVLFSFQRNEDRASLYEMRGLTVCFGGLDEFFAALTSKTLAEPTSSDASDPLDIRPALRPVTIDVAHASDRRQSDVSAMFNGWPATHADILAGLTFERDVSTGMASHLQADGTLVATLLGASGVGKTTAARQTLQILRREGFLCWEHKVELPLSPAEWFAAAEHCKAEGITGVLFVDDADAHLYELNDLADRLFVANNFHVRLLLAAARHQWNPRVKTPTLFKVGKEFRLSQLSFPEIERLLTLVDTEPQIHQLVEPVFAGFSRADRRRRLVDRCHADMFVCLRNIFASESFDDIILREYAGLIEALQDIYRYVAAMEHLGVNVHRQMLIRILGIPSSTIQASLEQLSDIIDEDTISEKEGVYRWHTRHFVIAGIVARYKFPNLTDNISLLELVISNLNPTYDIEIRSIRELCSVGGGIPGIPSKDTQNRLLRKIISIAPGERVPRHRLIRNLIDLDQYDRAETEIRIFERDFGIDGPVYRYKVSLLISRAVNFVGILKGDRVQILEAARGLALAGIARFPLNKALLATYAELGVQYVRLTGEYKYFDEAVERLHKAEDEIGDPDIARIIARYKRRIQGQASDDVEGDL